MMPSLLKTIGYMFYLSIDPSVFEGFAQGGYCWRWSGRNHRMLFSKFFVDSWIHGWWKNFLGPNRQTKKTHQIHSPLKISVKNIRTSAVVSELHPTSPNPPHFNHLGRPEAATRLQTQSLRFGCRVAPVTGWMPCVHGGFWYVLVGYLPWKKNTHFRTWTTRVLRRWVGPFWGC